MFNSAVFLAAAAVLGVLFLLFPLRLQMLVSGCNRRCDRAATDALFEHRERQSPDAEAPSLGLYGRPSYRSERAEVSWLHLWF